MVVVVVIGLTGGVATLVADTSNSRGFTSILSFLLVGMAPVAIAASMYRKRVVDIHTVLGAICIYVLIGMFFVFVFTTIGELGSGRSSRNRRPRTPPTTSPSAS